MSTTYRDTTSNSRKAGNDPRCGQARRQEARLLGMEHKERATIPDPSYNRLRSVRDGRGKAEVDLMPPPYERWRHPAFAKRYRPEAHPKRRDPFRAINDAKQLRILDREELAALVDNSLTSCEGKFYRCADLERGDKMLHQCGWYGTEVRQTRPGVIRRCEECIRLRGK